MSFNSNAKRFNSCVAFVALFVMFWLVASSALGQTQQPGDERDLPPNQSFERDMTGAETHRYKFDLNANEFFQVRVEQKGVDVELKLLDASGNVLAKMDSPNGIEGPETLSFVTAKEGRYALEIRGFDSKAGKGRYTIRRETPRTATSDDKRRVEVESLFLEGIKARDAEGQRDRAIKILEAASVAWQGLRDEYLTDMTLTQIKQLKLAKANALYDEGLVVQQQQTLKTYRVAFEAFLAANRQYKELDNKKGEAKSLVGMGFISSELGEHRVALEYFNQALLLSRIASDIDSEANSLNRIGIVYLELSDPRQALKFLNEALPLYRKSGNKKEEASVLNNIGQSFEKLREVEQALKYLNEALLLHRSNGEKRGESTTLSNIGMLYLRIGETGKALEYLNKTLELDRSSGDKSGLASTLHNIGAIHSESGDKRQALKYYEEALPLRRALGDKMGEAYTLNNIMYNWAALENRRLAIFYGKQSVNKFQELRHSIQGLDKETQTAYLREINGAYETLAEILIAEGRILEAEQVLEMLKQEEVFDYLRRDASESDKLQQRADLSKQEADALKRYNDIADKITTLGDEFGTLEQLKRDGVVLKTEQEKRYTVLSAQIEDANRSFQVFLRQLVEEFARHSNAEKDMQENLALQSDLKSWGKDVVFLYTLVGEDRYRVILVTSATQVDGKSDINEAALNDKIEKFRAAVQDPKVDPRPLGKELYDILIKPIEKQLDGAKAKTLLWSFDGSLRLLPIAALWDGKQYFGQKYQNVTVTLASRTRLGDANASNWHALGLGVSEAKKITEPNGTRELSFPSLPAVRAELRSIVQSAQSPKGVMPGQSLIDADFSEIALEAQLLRGYNVVHIASHFSLNPGDSTRSFLLLGDGNVLTVDEIKNNPKLSFRGVELLTLSACQTAVVEKDSSGKEIEGFGYVAQQKGAKAILATLWSVADESTQLLMSEFYRLRKKNPQITKAAALQMAQQEMIAGKLKPSADVAARRKTSDTSDVNPAPLDYSHPYYWSPFVLIGNWR